MADGAGKLHVVDAQANHVDVVAQVVNRLPQLPSVLRYYDEFSDKTHCIREPMVDSLFVLQIAGRKVSIDFACFSAAVGLLMKHLFAFLIDEGLNVSTAANYIICGSRLRHEDVQALLAATPTQATSVWAALRARTLSAGAYSCAKAILRLLCRHRLCGWSDSYNEFLSTALPLPAQDKYAGVRTGDVFLSVEAEAAVVRYLDELTSIVSGPEKLCVADEDLGDAAMVLCAYQFGMRPIQIAMVTMRDVRIWQDSENGPPTVHLTFRMVKQRSAATSKPLPRRIKREWAPLFVELERRLRARGLGGGTRVFGVESGQAAGLRIANRVRRLIGGEMTATDLRHTAAQRLVDAGASQEELAQFLGHSDITTGLVYFESSPNQAARVNKALGISEVYQRVAKIAHDRFINPGELAELKGEQQIAGVPHGIPIAGIGGCESGQPACPYNPVLSCYGCRKFMPLHDVKIHEQVLEDFCGVVRFFYDAARGDTSSSAYQQLQRTIAEVQTVIAELKQEKP